jgi:hypothetical protein
MRFRLAPGVFLCGLLAATAALGQTFYKSTMPDGKIILGDKPAPGAAKVEEMRVTPGNIAPSNPSGAAPPIRRGDESSERRAPMAAPPGAPRPVVATPGGAGAAQGADPDARLREAQDRFDAASAAADRGREPLEGERTGTASGMSRLNDVYWARQKQLDDSVSAAQQELDAARAAAAR